MDSVVQSVEIILLAELCKLELAGGRAVLGLDAHGQVLLGAVSDDLAQKLGEFCGVLGLLKAGLLPVQTDLGITLAVRDARHRKIHTDLGALALEVCSQALDDLIAHLFGNIGTKLLADADNMLRCPAHAFLLLDELGTGNLALGAELRGSISLVNITAYGANPFLHSKFPPQVNSLLSQYIYLLPQLCG